MKNPFKEVKQKDEPAKLSKTKTAVAEMILDDELMKMVAGGGSPTNALILKGGVSAKVSVLQGE